MYKIDTPLAFPTTTQKTPEFRSAVEEGRFSAALHARWPRALAPVEMPPNEVRDSADS